MATTNLGRVRFNMRGDYNPSADPLYSLLDLVSYGGGSFVYINDTPSNEPTSSTSHWQQIASVGGQDILDAVTAEKNAAIAAKVLAEGYAAQLAAGTASPAGTYANLAVLNSGTPTAPDVTKIYITLDDGNWCYWNGSAWVAGGVYQATERPLDTTLSVSGMAADAKVTGDKVGELKSAFDSFSSITGELKNGYIEYDNGKIQPSDIRKYFEFQTSCGAKFLYKFPTQAYAFGLAFYSADGTYLEGEMALSTQDVIAVAPDGTALCRATVRDETDIIPIRIYDTVMSVVETASEVYELQGEIDNINAINVYIGQRGNLCNKDEAIAGFARGNLVGTKQEINNTIYLGYHTVKVPVKPNTNYTFYAVNVVSQTDEDEIVTAEATWVNITETHTVTTLSTTRILFISCKDEDLDTMQIEEGNDITYLQAYNQYSEMMSSSMPVLDLPVIDKSSYVTNVIESIKNGVYSDMKQTIDTMRKSIETMSMQQLDKTIDTQTIALKRNTKQKAIIHLHKRQNNGYGTVNDVYLPHAEDDFSDVVVKDQNGVSLPYSVVYSGDIDVIADSRLGMNNKYKLLHDSNGKLYKFEDSRIKYSDDNGCSWNDVFNENFSGYGRLLNYITSDDTMFFAIGNNLYRSEAPYTSYENVLTMPDVGSYILPSNFVELPTGELFVASYYIEPHIYIVRSDDGGDTWTEVFNGYPENVQHVHHLYCDATQNPVAVYAGCDSEVYRGVIYKTTDLGNTWVTLNNALVTRDYGVIYAENGFRLIGGETTVLGGWSISKTTDDSNYTGVLGLGNSIFSIEKINGHLIAGAVCNGIYKQAQLLKSDDNGETWQSIYTTSPFFDENPSSVESGFPWISKFTYDNEDELLVSVQSSSRYPLRVYSGQGCHYAEIIVDVPDGTTQLTISNGSVCPNIIPVVNDYMAPNSILLDIDFSTGKGKSVADAVSGQIFAGNYTCVKGGRHLGQLLPLAQRPSESIGIDLDTIGDDGIIEKINLGISNGVTISMWGDLGERTINILKRGTIEVLKVVNGYFTNINSARFFPHPAKGVCDKYDIVISNGELKTYSNGILMSEVTMPSAFINAMNGEHYYNILQTLSTISSGFVQRFMIRSEAVSETDIVKEYYNGLDDNYQTT